MFLKASLWLCPLQKTFQTWKFPLEGNKKMNENHIKTGFKVKKRSKITIEFEKKVLKVGGIKWVPLGNKPSSTQKNCT